MKTLNTVSGSDIIFPEGHVYELENFENKEAAATSMQHNNN